MFVPRQTNLDSSGRRHPLRRLARSIFEIAPIRPHEMRISIASRTPWYRLSARRFSRS